MSQYSSQVLSITDIARSVALDLTGGSARIKFQHTYENDRVAFIYDVMPTLAKTITDYQLNILDLFDSGINRIALRGPHGLGKTFIASILVHHKLLTATTDCKVPTTASSSRQLIKYLWPEIRKSASHIAWPVVGRDAYDIRTEMLTQNIKLQNGMIEAFAVSSDNFALIEGAHATQMFYILDECKSIVPGMWDAVEGAFSTEGLNAPETIAVQTLSDEAEVWRDRGSIAYTQGSQYSVQVLAISTPGAPIGRFYDIHLHKPGYEDWYTVHVTLEEAIAAGRISPKWAKQRAKQWGVDSSTYRNRVLGEFADNSEEGIIPLSWVKAANKRWEEWDKAGRPEASNNTVRTAGVDTARMGKDQTVLALREASVLSDIYRFSKVLTTVTAGHITNYCRHRTIIIEMDGGLGASVYDMLKEEERDRTVKIFKELKPVTVSSKTFYRDKSGELAFYNVRAAMWWHLRELLDPDNGYDIALPPNDTLTLDLITPEWSTIRNGVIILESKKSIKRKIGRSTDLGDAVCLAFWDMSSGGGIVF